MANMDFSILSVALLLAVGFGLGLRHALEPDHLAAVSTIISDRRSLLGSSIVGAIWGAGHTLALLIAGILVIGFRFEISDRFVNLIELFVGVMLMALGVNSLRKLLSGGELHSHVHTHGNVTHSHPHVHDRDERTSHDVNPDTAAHHGLRKNSRPFFVGLVHGFAGSGALMLLILATISSPLVAMAYIVVFGIGSVAGMVLMSTAIALPFHLAINRHRSVHVGLQWIAGLFSIAFGIFWIYSNDLLRSFV
jgi:high-affinity nickel permease